MKWLIAIVITGSAILLLVRGSNRLEEVHNSLYEDGLSQIEFHMVQFASTRYSCPWTMPVKVHFQALLPNGRPTQGFVCVGLYSEELRFR